MKLTPEQTQAAQGTAGGLSAVFGYRGAIKSAKASKESTYQQADQLLNNARARLSVGNQEATRVARGGQVAISDAIANFGGSGAATDPVLLAKLQRRATYNSMAALFQGTSDAGNMRIQAADMKRDAAKNYTSRVKAAQTNALVGVLDTGLKVFGAG